jgi:WD40 repeat protein
MRRLGLACSFAMLTSVVVLAQMPTKAHTALVHCVALSSDGKLLATAGFDNTVKVWDVEGGAIKEKGALAGHTGPVYAVAFSADGKMLVSASLDKTARVWNLADKKTTAEIKGHTDIVDTVAILPDAKRIATGSADKSVKLWNVSDGKEAKALGVHTASVYSVAISPDGKLLASGGGGDNIIKVWDVAAGKESKQLKGHEQAITGLVFTDNTTLASISLDRTVRVWNTADGKETKKLGPTTDDPYGIAWASKSKKLATCGYSGLLNVWDVAAGKATFTAKVNSPGYTVAIDADAKTLFSGHDNGTVVVTAVK